MLQGPYQQLKLDIKAALFIVKYLHKRMTSERKLTSKELKKILGEILLNPFLTLEMLKIFFVLQKLDTLDIYFLFFSFNSQHAVVKHCREFKDGCKVSRGLHRSCNL